MKINDAKNYINFGIKEGHYEADWFEDMTNEELIGFAESQELKADANYESLKEQNE